MNGKSEEKIRLSRCFTDQSERDAVTRVFDSNYFGMGPEVEKFENEIKNFLGTSKEVICVNTGTSALHLSLLCLDLGPGDEVLVPSITYVASFQAISATGARPIACDILPTTGFIDIADAAKKLGPKTKAIMPVHYASDSSAMNGIYEFAKQNKLRVIEDAAHSFASQRDGKYIGVEGDILCFSFDGIKNITCGEGGAILTSDQALAERIKDSRLLGVEKDTENRFKGKRSWDFDVKHQGLRYHMSDINAAIGRSQLEKVNFLKTHRQEIANFYLENLERVGFLDLDYKNIMPHIFVVQTDDTKKEAFVAHLENREIPTGTHYKPNHFLTKFKTSYSLRNAEHFYQRSISLPMHPGLTKDELFRIKDAVNSFGR